MPMLPVRNHVNLLIKKTQTRAQFFCYQITKMWLSSSLLNIFPLYNNENIKKEYYEHKTNSKN